MRRDHRRRKQRRQRQATALLHLRHMLVTELQRIAAPGDVAVLLEARDQGLAAAGIAADGVAGVRPVRRQQPGAHQGRDEGDEAGRIAPGIGNAVRIGDRAVPDHLGKAVDPAGRDPVRGRGVDHPHFAAGLDQGDGLACGIVRQAQDREIGRVERLGARGRILAPGLVEHDEIELGAPRQPFGDLEPGGAGGTVDEYAVGHQPNASSRSSDT